MKILSVISGLGYGGAESQLMLIAAELSRRGHEAVVYLLTDHAPRIAALQAAGVEVIVDRKRSRLDLAVVGRLRAFLRSRRPDVVHGYLFDGNWYATVAAIGLGVPVLCAERSSDYRLSTAQWLAHWPVRSFVSGVIANSERGRVQARALFGLPDRHAHVVWNGLDLASIDRRLSAPPPDARTDFFGRVDIRLAVLVGSFNEAKDQLLAIEVIRHLVGLDPRWRLLLVGASFGDRLGYANTVADASTRYEATVRDRIAAAGLGEHVRLAGQRPDALELIGAADVLLSTSRREGSPNVVLEAMAAGTPVVATDFSDIGRLLPQPWQVVGDRDPLALAQAVLKVHACGDAVAAEQRQWVETHATIGTTVDALLRLYAAYGRAPAAPAHQTTPGA